MNPPRLLASRVTALALGATALAFSAIAADDPEDAERSGWFVRLGGRVSSGMKATLRDTRPAGALVAGAYDDGFVQPAAGGNPVLTANWGYQSAAQVQGNDLVFHRLDGAPRGGERGGLKDDPQFGGEIVTGFEFFRFGIGKREARFGFEFGHSYSQFTVSDRAVATGSATYTVDRFALDAASAGNPVTPPLAPYAGAAGTPGPLIGLGPSAHTVLTTTGTSALDSKLDGEFHNLRIGPWIEVPITSRMSLSLSAGYVAIYSSSRLDLAESVAFADPTVPLPAAASGRFIATHWSPGAYAQIRADYHLTRHVGVYVGGDIQHSTGATVGAPGREARIDFGDTYGAVAGVSYTF